MDLTPSGIAIKEVIRGIEDYWGLIKGGVYKDGWEAQNLDQLRIILSCFKKVDQKMRAEFEGESTRRIIDTIRRFALVEMRTRISMRIYTYKQDSIRTEIRS